MPQLKIRLFRQGKVQKWCVELNGQLYGVVAQEDVPKLLMQLAIGTQVPILGIESQRLQ